MAVTLIIAFDIRFSAILNFIMDLVKGRETDEIEETILKSKNPLMKNLKITSERLKD
jgi:hypothetical protein